jgi:hypothetical protein
VRQAYVLVTVGAVLPVLMVTACSGKPNDLRHYRDEEPPAAADSSSTSEQTRVDAPPAAPPSPSRTPARLDRHALSSADLAEEEVRPEGVPSRAVLNALADCGAPLRAGSPATAGYQAAWAYSTGATLRQYVASYPDGAAAVLDVVRDSLDCGRFRAGEGQFQVDPSFELPPAEGVDSQLSWCSQSPRQSTCTLLLAKGPLLSAVAVTASADSRAKAAVTRIAPRAVTALGRE